jgi:hypothetical protein
MDTQEKHYQHIKALLLHNVPRFISHIKARGGATEEETKWLTCETEEFEYPIYIIERADEYLLFPKNKEIFNKSLFILVKALAIMSFIPCGISFFDLHFDSTIENFVQNES